MVAGMRCREREQQHSGGRCNSNRSMHELTSHSRRSGNALGPAEFPSTSPEPRKHGKDAVAAVSSTPPNARPRRPEHNIPM
jgi:hypothetical protein